MNCEEAKELIRRGQRDRADEHLTSCLDCMAFAEDFTEVAEYLNEIPQAHASSNRVFNDTFAVAKAELERLNPSRARSTQFRMAMAAVFAVIVAPLLITLNYIIAAGGQMLLSRWLPPAFGLAFFVIQALGAVVALSIAYGSLPLLIAAARNIPNVRTAQGGLIA